jgi:glutathione S-transferase
MGLVLYGHPFSSYTQKVLVAMWEFGLDFDFRSIAPDEPRNVAEWAERWPLRAFPVLVDEGRTVAESTIIIEHLQLAHPVRARLLPEDPRAALEVRFLDRFFDNHVMSPMQAAVQAALTGDPARRAEGLARAAERLEVAYAWVEQGLAGRTWAAGEAFTLADCAAAPSLFYADWTHRIGEAYPRLRAYRARLLARPTMGRAVDGGRPFRHFFPLGAPDRD